MNELLHDDMNRAIKKMTVPPLFFFYLIMTLGSVQIHCSFILKSFLIEYKEMEHFKKDQGF